MVLCHRRSIETLDAMAAPRQRLQTDVFADYYQFYVWDANQNPRAPVNWSDDDVENRLKVAEHVVVIRPVRNMIVPVTFEVHDAAPGCSLDDWDHVAECSISCPSGKFSIQECSGDSVGSIIVAAGTYRIRVYYGNLASLSADGLDGDDRYLLTIWTAPAGPMQILKRWPVANASN